MGEKVTVVVATLIAALMLPYLLTVLINGRNRDTESILENIDTGRDVLCVIDGENRLIDVEQYISWVLPEVVEVNSDTSVMEAQAVAVRTRIYYEMGENTVIGADKLNYKIVEEQFYINKYGRENVDRVKEIYQRAVLNTVGTIIE